MMSKISKCAIPIFGLVFFCILTLGSSAQEAEIEFGPMIHPSRQYVIFTGRNTGDFDAECSFKVQARYIDKDGKNIGQREVFLKTILPANNVKFTEEAGRDIIQAIASQWSDPTIFDVLQPEKECTTNIKQRYGTLNYEGTMRNGKSSGFGVLIDSSSGYKYEGNFENGKREGEGSESYPNKSEFNGKFHDNARSGEGHEAFSNGQKYDGMFAAGKRSGAGVYTWPNGSKFVGSWIDNQRSGFGTMYTGSKKTYEGYWRDDKYNGFGKTFDSSTLGSNSQSKLIAKGYFVNNELKLGGNPKKIVTLISGLNLKICNDSAKTVSFAIATRYQDRWYAKGWWIQKSQSCFSPNFGWSPNAEIYVLAVTDPNFSGSQWRETPRNAKFCVDTVNEFSLDDEYCQNKAHPDYKFSTFYALDWPNNYIAKEFHITD